jgi:hypothetical protein
MQWTAYRVLRGQFNMTMLMPDLVRAAVLGPVKATTKFGLPMDEAGRLKGASRAYVMTAVEESLKRLKTEWTRHPYSDRARGMVR